MTMIGKMGWYTAKETLGLCSSRVWMPLFIPDFDGSDVAIRNHVEEASWDE